MTGLTQEINSLYFATDLQWNDNCRGVQNGKLIVYGKNITDSCLMTQKGTVTVVRTENMNEKLGLTDPSLINCGEYGSLADVLSNINEHSKYKGFKIDFGDLPPCVAYRCSTTFVPLTTDESSKKIVPANYSYNTFDEEDPTNMLLVVTPTGISVHTDTVGWYRLYAESVDNGEIHTHWYEAEKTDFAVGHAQAETPTDAEEHKTKRAKVTSLGPDGDIQTCSRMLVVSIPLKKKPPHPPSYQNRSLSSSLSCDQDDGPKYRNLSAADAYAARLNVSEDVVDTVSAKNISLVRDTTSSIVVTQCDYNVVIVPANNPRYILNKRDAEWCIKAMERSYGLGKFGTCKLSELPAMLHKFEKSHMEEIQKGWDASKEKSIKQAKKSAMEDPFKPIKNALAAFE